MSETKVSTMVYPRLCFAYFLQFSIWGSWAMTLGGYADKVLSLDVGILYTAIPLAAVSALFIGPIVDRKFAAERVLGVLHLVGGVCLIACAMQKSLTPLLILMIMHGVCYMPSMALMNSVVFRHIPNSNNAPKVFVFGTIGWIVVNLFIDIFCGGALKPNFFYIGGGAAILLGLYSFTLPHTPPAAQAVEPGQKAGSMFDSLKMFKDPVFLVFAVCVLCASIPACGFYFPMGVPLFTERDYPSPVALTTLNQFSELIFMLALPFFASKIGLKKCLLLGMGAWALRYFFFMQSAFSFAILGLLLHGFCYSFLYVAAYMYADKKSPPAMKASVQGLMAFLLLGLGQVFGSLMVSYEFAQNPAPFSKIKIASKADDISLPVWNDPNLENSAWKYLNLSATVNGMLGRPQPPVYHLGEELDENKDNVITKEEIDKVPEEGLKNGVGDDAVTFTKADIMDIFGQIANYVAKKDVPQSDIDISVSRKDWLAVQMRDWNKILLHPIIVVVVFLMIFVVLGKDPDAKTKPEEEKTVG